MTRKLKLFFAGLFVTGWLLFIGPSYAFATENINQEQVIVSQLEIIESANNDISEAQTVISQIIADSETIIAPTDSVTSTITEAQDAIAQVETIVDGATAALEYKEQATAAATTAISEKNIAISNLEAATTTLQLKTTALNVAQSAVNAQTIVVNTETSELTALQNTPSNSMTYTTDGYVAPENIDTNVISTVVLPPMGDASTRITTPFDIKLGETLYEGQGNNSQLYVTSKSALTFGQGDHTYWDWPSIAGIYVFQSDYMSSGTGASITVTTTSNTLAISWDLKRFGDSNGPTTNTDLFMIVDPNSGEWTATATIAGNTTGLYGGPRTGVREVTGQPVQSMMSVGNEQLQSQIADQQLVVQEETAELNNLITVKNIASSEKTVASQNLTTANTNYNIKNTAATNAVSSLTYATDALNQAVALIAPAISNMNTIIDEAQTAVEQAIIDQTPIDQPTNISAIQLSNGDVQVSWDSPTGLISPERYAISWSIGDGGWGIATGNVGDENALNTSIILPVSLFEGTGGLDNIYQISVRSDNDSLTKYSEAATIQLFIVDPTPPPPVFEPPVIEPPVEEPPTEEPPVEEPPTEEPPTEEPPTEEPEVEEPVTEEPTVEEPTQEEVVGTAVEDALGDGKITASDAEDILNALNSDGEITSEEVNNLSDALSADGKLTSAEKDLIADSLLESVDEGEALTSEQIEEAGIDFKDLPPETPVDVRTDENGNAVVITAEVAAQVELLQNPSELLSTAFSDPGAALAALGSIGADMSDVEREEATDMVVATVVAAGAAINAASVAAGGATGGSTGGGTGGSSGGGSGANSPGSRGGRRW